MVAMSPVYSVRIRGELACFTRPEFKTERVSYEVITPSAARGIIEAVLWKPAIRWHIRRILVLAPPRFIQFKRHEVTKRASTYVIEKAARQGVPVDYFADEDRSQRNTLALRDVDYAIEAQFAMTEQASPEDNPRKFDEMFRRRLQRGQFFMQPCLGCREFPAVVEPYNGNPSPIDSGSRDLGFMLQDIRFGPSGNEPVFFRATIQNGVIEVPHWQGNA